MYMLKIVITKRIEISERGKGNKKLLINSIEEKKGSKINLQRKNKYKVQQDEKEDKLNMSEISMSIGSFIHC